jgi:hypothetical protein
VVIEHVPKDVRCQDEKVGWERAPLFHWSAEWEGAPLHSI